MDKIKVKEEFSVNSHTVESQVQHGLQCNNQSIRDINQPDNSLSVESQKNDDTMHNVEDTHCLTEPITIKGGNQLENKMSLERHQNRTICAAVDTEPVPLNPEQTQCTVNTKNSYEIGSSERVKDEKTKHATIENDNIPTCTYWKVISQNPSEGNLQSPVNLMKTDQPNLPYVSENVSIPDPQVLTIFSTNQYPRAAEEVDNRLLKNPHNTSDDQSFSQMHINTYANERVFVCMCGKGFNQFENLKLHMRIHTNEMPFICKECGKGFSQSRHLSAHIKTHTNERPFVCEECGKGFKVRSNLLGHMKIHRNEKPFVCEECNKGFSQSSNLKTHMRIHANVRPFVCEECGRGFKARSNLTGHMRIHRNERKFVCVECNKGFNTNSNLKTHMRIHTNEIQFLCIECGKGFNCNSSLKRHMRIHTNEQPFVCIECGKEFNCSSSRKRHMKIHTNERPFVCKECGKGFKRKDSLNSHMTQHTGI